jgi:hypothetical protein
LLIQSPWFFQERHGKKTISSSFHSKGVERKDIRYTHSHLIHHLPHGFRIKTKEIRPKRKWRDFPRTRLKSMPSSCAFCEDCCQNFTAIYLKQCGVSLQRDYAGSYAKHDSLSRPVSLTRTGLPKIIPIIVRRSIRVRIRLSTHSDRWVIIDLSWFGAARLIER